MNKHFIFRSVAIVTATLFLLTSCDKDYNELGSGIVGDDHFDFLPDSLSSVRAYSQTTGKVQANNLEVNALGIHINPVFGKTKANFVTELQLDSSNPELAPEKFISLDSVVLTVPYFSTKTETTSDGVGIYELDSIHNVEPINLKIYESGYLLNDLDPDDNFQTAQRYYSDEDSQFDSNRRGLGANGASVLHGQPLNNGVASQNTNFVPNNKEFVVLKKDKGFEQADPKAVDRRMTPRVRIFLDTTFFKKKIFEAPAGKLANNSVFKEYFKGIYFQVQDAATGHMMQLDFSQEQANITLYYKEYTNFEDADDNPATPETPLRWPADDPLYPGKVKETAREFVLNLAGNTVNLLEFQPNGDYTSGVANPNTNDGDARLFVKGGEGSVAIIDLFGPDNFGSDGLTGSPDGVADELNIIRNQGWLINEANLTFYIDRQAMNGAAEPQRVYLYDLTNNQPLFDFGRDQSSISGKPKFQRYVHDGLLQRAADGRGTKYRVRITNHIRNLIRNDSTNVRLALAVNETFGNISNGALKSPTTIPGAFANSEAFTFDRIPFSSIMNPLGTILYGNNIPVGDTNYDKRLKLEIYYTKPN